MGLDSRFWYLPDKPRTGVFSPAQPDCGVLRGKRNFSRATYLRNRWKHCQTGARS